MPHRAAVLVLVELLSGGVPARAGAPIRTTLYLHAPTAVANADELGERRGGQGPTMSEDPPSGSAPKVALVVPLARQEFRKNTFASYWAGPLSGIVHDPIVTLWIQAPTGGRFEVLLFGDGGIGQQAPAARRQVEVEPGGPVRVVADFTGLELVVRSELVVQVNTLTGLDAFPAGLVWFDSVDFPASVSLWTEPIPNTPFDDPFGIAFRSGQLVVADAGSGRILLVEGAEVEVVASGFTPGGFRRGVAGLAVDGGGTIYAALPDSGEVVFVRPDGERGIYARDLGAPVGIAFDAAGNLYAADTARGQVLRVSPDQTISVVATLEGPPYGLALAPHGALAVSVQPAGRVYRVDPASGSVTLLADLGAGHSAEGLAYAASGALYVGDGRAGRVVRVGPDGDLAAVAGRLGGPLNLAFRPGTEALVVATQGEGRAAGDAVLALEVGEPGAPLAHPFIDPVPLPPLPARVHRAGGVPENPAAFGAGLPQAQARPVGQRAAEPTLGVQADGDVYYVAASGGSKILRSAGGEGPFEDVSPRLLGRSWPPVTLDPYLWVDPSTGRVFSIDLYVGCSYLSWTDDDGATWLSNPLACGIPGNDHQTLAGGPPPPGLVTVGYPNALYYCYNGLLYTGCSRSLDGGLTWVGVAPPYPGRDEAGDPVGGGLTGHVVVDPQGRVLLPRNSGQATYLAISEDGGASWRIHLVSATVGTNGDHEANVASDTQGNLYVVWMGRDRRPYLAISRDHGWTWSEPKMVAPPGVTEANLPMIDAGAPGRVAISYMGTTLDYGYDAPNYARAAWNGYVTVTTDALDPDPVFATTVINPPADPLIRGRCGPGRCGNVFDFLDVVIAPDGRVWASFVDTCTGPCATDRTAPSDDGQGLAVSLVGGPRLR